jgi:hypothetical protein
MCIECNCFGTVTPYGVGGRTPTELPKEPNVAMYNKPIFRIGETPYGMKPEMDNYDDEDGM